MDTPSNSRASSMDLEQAIARIDKLAEKVEKQNGKNCCRLTKPRVAAITTLISGIVSAAVTLGAIYGKCQQPPAAPPL